MKTSNRYRVAHRAVIDSSGPKLLSTDDTVKQLNDFDTTAGNQKLQIQQLRDALKEALKWNWIDHADSVEGGGINLVNINWCHEIALAMNKTGGDL